MRGPSLAAAGAALAAMLACTPLRAFAQDRAQPATAAPAVGHATGAAPTSGPCENPDPTDLEQIVRCQYTLGDHGSFRVEDRRVLPPAQGASSDYAAVRLTATLRTNGDRSCRKRLTFTWHRDERGWWSPLQTYDQLGPLRQLEAQGDYEGLVVRARRLLRDDPLSIDVHVLLSDALEALGDGAEAERMIAAALSIDPENTDALLASVRRATDVDTAARRWARIPQDACDRMTAYFNYAIRLQGRVRIDFLAKAKGLSEADRTLLMSPALVQARDMRTLRRFLTPARVLEAYRELHDGGYRPEFREAWGLQMALIVGHVYGLDLAERWVQIVVDAAPGSGEAQGLTGIFGALRRANATTVPLKVLYQLIPESGLTEL